jgi:DNA-directed RNA polymerase specialized sigma24 family protein
VRSPGEEAAVTPVAPGPAPSWSALVERIRTGDSTACEELYSTAFADVRRWFSRRLGAQYAEDRTHDTYLATIRAIVNGGPREPDRLPGFILGIAQRQLYVSVRGLLECRAREIACERLVLSDPAPDLDSAILRRQERYWVKRVLGALSGPQREILVRFYMWEQTPGEIRTAMALTPTQFRLLKWRAKAEFEALARKRLQGQELKLLATRWQAASVQHSAFSGQP